MPKINPQVEQLEREVRVLRAQIDRMREDPGDMPFAGCGDHSCICASAKGMGTNGGCLCNERALRRAVQYWRRVAQFRQDTIQQMGEKEPTR